eukprot:jgi/Botrbrau1/10518/Bobra.7_1s0002.1
MFSSGWATPGILGPRPLQYTLVYGSREYNNVADPSATFGDVKAQASEITGIPPQYLALQYRGRTVRDDVHLLTAGLRPGAKILVTETQRYREMMANQQLGIHDYPEDEEDFYDAVPQQGGRQRAEGYGQRGPPDQQRRTPGISPRRMPPPEPPRPSPPYEGRRTPTPPGGPRQGAGNMGRGGRGPPGGGGRGRRSPVPVAPASEPAHAPSPAPPEPAPAPPAPAAQAPQEQEGGAADPAAEQARMKQQVDAVRIAVDGLEEKAQEVLAERADEQHREQACKVAELLTQKLLTLDEIHVEGEARVMRKAQINRINSLCDRLESFRSADSGIQRQPARGPAPLPPTETQIKRRTYKEYFLKTCFFAPDHELQLFSKRSEGLCPGDLKGCGVGLKEVCGFWLPLCESFACEVVSKVAMSGVSCVLNPLVSGMSLWSCDGMHCKRGTVGSREADASHMDLAGKKVKDIVTSRVCND